LTVDQFKRTGTLAAWLNPTRRGFKPTNYLYMKLHQEPILQNILPELTRETQGAVS
jgi:hypothetical protein